MLSSAQLEEAQHIYNTAPAQCRMDDCKSGCLHLKPLVKVLLAEVYAFRQFLHDNGDLDVYEECAENCGERDTPALIAELRHHRQYLAKNDLIEHFREWSTR